MRCHSQHNSILKFYLAKPLRYNLALRRHFSSTQPNRPLFTPDGKLSRGSLRRVFWHIFHPMITRRVICTKKHVGEVPRGHSISPYVRSREWLGMDRVNLGETFVNTFSALLMLIFDKYTSFNFVLFISIILGHNFCNCAIHTPEYTHSTLLVAAQALWREEVRCV